MKTNRSPWIHELDPERKPVALLSDITTDVVIVGAGIAGTATAFFTLKYTDKRVVMVEKGLIAHGATGHNAGQLLADFERPFDEIVEQFGFELATSAWRDLRSGWDLLSEMYSDSGCNIPFSRFSGYIGKTTLNQTLIYLEELALKTKAGFRDEQCFISTKTPFLSGIPEKYKNLYTLVEPDFIKQKLETDKDIFHVLVQDERGCLNSALLCQEVLKFLSVQYLDRFSLYENTSVHKVVLHDSCVILDTYKHTVTADKVVLCTNGFEGFEIFDKGGLAVDMSFHRMVKGEVGYMSGYLEKMNKAPTGVSYFMPNIDPRHEEEGDYFYLTRRPYDIDLDRKPGKFNLVCVGGPETHLEDREEYIFDFDFPEDMQKSVDTFIKEYYETDPNKKIDYHFTWHGLMGYTPDRIRRVGVEPKEPNLLYNIGCNGIGLIPSVFGGRRIARILAGEKLPPSIFDPRLN